VDAAVCQVFDNRLLCVDNTRIVTFSFALQIQQVELLASLQDKEALLHETQSKLQKSEAKLFAAEKSALEALHAAGQRHIAVEERARLSEQVCL